MPIRVLTAPISPETHEHFVLVTATPADDVTDRTPMDVSLVVDTSGSMGAPATISDADGEGHGLSMLDIVKHAVRTVGETLDGDDSCSLVSFHSSAKLETGPLRMTFEGQAAMHATTKPLRPEGQTNLWDGLKTGLDALRAAPIRSPEGNSAVLILTDGMPNIVPPRGHEAMLERYRDEHGPVGMVSTFGFGYQLDSALLAGLASRGGGAYAFVPDASFVGTAFVHALANLLATRTPQAAMALEVAGGAELLEVVGLRHDAASWGANVPLGPIQHGQPRDVLLRVRLPPGGSLRAALKDTIHGDMLGTSAEVSAASHGPVVAGSAEALALDEQRCRLRLLATISDALESADEGALLAAEAQRAALAADIKVTMQAYASGSLAGGGARQSAFLDALLTDVNGQMAEALSRRDWWLKWGHHYLRSLRCAHELQICNNFKDASVQGYGGSLFAAARDRADGVFLTLPPPEPSLTRTRTLSRGMHSFSDPSNPCFHADSRVLLASGASKPLRDLRRGDVVRAAGGRAATVRCVVRTPCPSGEADLVTLPGGLRVTPWHPVRAAGEVAWRFPARDVAGAARGTVPCDAVISVLLDEGQSELTFVDGMIEGIALGHGGFMHDPVASHAFFGRRDAVVAVLASMRGWAEGVIELDPSAPVVRDAASGLVCGLCEQGRTAVDADTSSAPADVESSEPTRGTRISAELDALQARHEATGWTPGAAHVRPAPATRAQKELVLANVRQSWASDADWVSHEVFRTTARRAADGKRHAARPPRGAAVLAPQPFSYELPRGTMHSVYWMATSGEEWTDERITAGIAARINGGEFVWYPNPKPSVTDAVLSHVQVFWRPAVARSEREEAEVQGEWIVAQTAVAVAA